MLDIPERRKGGAPMLGATAPGQAGPYGLWPADDEPDFDDDDELDDDQDDGEPLAEDEKGSGLVRTPGGDLPLDDDALADRLAQAVDTAVAGRIAAARARREEQRQQRTELGENRRHGLQRRHRTKASRSDGLVFGDVDGLEDDVCQHRSVKEATADEDRSRTC